MIRNALYNCSVKYPYGVKGPYKPKVMPQRFTVPVDFSARTSTMDSLEEPREDEAAVYDDHMRQLRTIDGLSPIKLGSIPSDKTVADMYNLCFASVLEGKLHIPREYDSLCPLDSFLSSSKATLASVDTVSLHTKEHSNMNIQRFQNIWSVLEKMKLSSPVYGALALKGENFIRATITNDLHCAFPRLNSTHTAYALSLIVSLYSCLEIATRLHITDATNLLVDVLLFKERNMLYQRSQYLKNELLHSKDPSEGKGERIWLLKKELRKIKETLSSIPGDEIDLLARMQWIQQHVFAFLGLFMLSHDTTTATTLVHRLFTGHINHPNPIQFDKTNQRIFQDRMQRRKWTIGYDSGSESPLDPWVEKHELPRVYHNRYTDKFLSDKDGFTVPAVLTLSVQPRNALKELYIIYRYAPDVPDEVRDTSTLQFTPEYTTLDQQLRSIEEHRYEQYRQTVDEQRAVVGRLFIGNPKQLIGVGIGKDEIHALQNAAKHAIHNYYFKRK